MGGRRGWVSLALALALVGAVGLAGCSGGDDPPPTVTSSLSPSHGTTGTAGSTTTSATTSATVAPVDLPAEATKHTEAGAEAFARYYTKLLDESVVSGDAGALKLLTSSKCSTCSDFIGVIDDRASRSERAKALSFKLGLSRAAPGSTLTAPVVDVLVEDAGSEIVNAKGDVVHRSAPAKLNFRHTLTWGGNSWRVLDSEII